MPHRDLHTRAAGFEPVRVVLVREIYRLNTFLSLLAVKMLPKKHPMRTYLEGDLKERRQRVIQSFVPSAGERYTINAASLMLMLLLAWIILSAIDENLHGPSGVLRLLKHLVF